jgi:hypothetical protein
MCDTRTGPRIGDRECISVQRADENKGEEIRVKKEEVDEDGERYIIRSFIISSSTFLMRIVLSRRKKWVGYVTHEGKQRHAYKFLVGRI